MILYRGINPWLYSNLMGTKFIYPYATNFERTFLYDGSITYNGNATYGSSVTNGIVGHQMDSKKFPASGISTTPEIDRARHYALHNDQFDLGYILEFDTSKMSTELYTFFEVARWVKFPHIPEDCEFIMKRLDNGPIPLDAIADIKAVYR